MIFFAGLLAHVAGMPRAGPRIVQSGRHPTGGLGIQNSQAFGPGGRVIGYGSRAFRCPGCNEAFASEYALHQHRASLSLDSRSGTAPLATRSGCALDERGPIVSRWEAAGQRAGGRVHNTSGAVSKSLKGRFKSDSDSGPDSESGAVADSGQDPGPAAAGSPQPSEPPLPSEVGARSPTDSPTDSPSRMRGPESNYQPSPPPAAAAPGASQQPPLPTQVRVHP